MGAAYRAAWWPAAPVLAGWLAADAGRRPALGRMRPQVPAIAGRPVWVHACSVGEVTVAIPLLRALQASLPDVPLLLTAATATGMALARERAGVPVAWFPIDHPLTVSRFFEQARPRALVILETELWPGVLQRAHATGVPVALVNGRLSDASAAAYRRFAALWRPAVAGIAAAGMQTPIYRDRIVALGAAPGRVQVTGNLKYDAAPARCTVERRRALRAALGIPADAPVVLFGSTRPGDEALIASGLGDLFRAHSELRAIVAPRHLDRVDEAEVALSAWPVARKSAIAGGVAAGARVVLLDTMGELSELYSVADVAVVGGSFSGEVGGHNPVEPAAQGVAVVFGPDMRNFPDIAAELLKADAAVQTPGADLSYAIDALLRDRARRDSLGQRALEAVARNRGSLERTLAMLLPLIAGRD